MQDAERQVAELVARWLRWLTAMSSDSVPAIRMDFLVRRSGAGRAEVHSLELTELGFSLLGWHGGPHIILDALLESCFDDTGPTDEEASALRAFRARRAHEIRGCRPA
mmetsp:Transcript_22520/g.50905  ORF Transcript_22520/g.50905 Transcript_22520/m.50905 type:complete len:108 (-) Transcript_22520:543-866(-)